MKQKAVVLLNTTIKNEKKLDRLLQDTPLIVCTNGGVNNLLHLDYEPDLIIGDFDSVDQELLKKLKKSKLIKYPEAKDKTDSDLAVEKVLELGAKEIIIVSEFTSSIDHVLANIFLLSKISKRGAKGKIISSEFEVHLIKNRIGFEKKKGKRLSLIPLTACKGVTIKGTLYPLEKGEIEFGQSLGLSNKIVEDKAVIEIKKGKALVVLKDQ